MYSNSTNMTRKKDGTWQNSTKSCVIYSDHRAFSYSQLMAFTCTNGKTGKNLTTYAILNTQKFSVTTSKHQRMIRSHFEGLNFIDEKLYFNFHSMNHLDKSDVCKFWTIQDVLNSEYFFEKLVPCDGNLTTLKKIPYSLITNKKEWAKKVKNFGAEIEKEKLRAIKTKKVTRLESNIKWVKYKTGKSFLKAFKEFRSMVVWQVYVADSNKLQDLLKQLDKKDQDFILNNIEQNEKIEEIKNHFKTVEIFKTLGD